MTSSVYDNGVSESRTYNVDNTPAAINFSGASIGNLSYTWDDNHNKTSETIGGTMSGYGFTASYDAEDRLTGWNRANATLDQSWNLTPVGDWQSFTENSSTQNRTHGPAHELTAAAGQAVQHDAKGNITLLPSSLRPQPSAFTWDFDNRLKSADINNNGTIDVEYQLDALGRRVARTESGSTTTVFVQNGQQTLADYASGASPSSPEYTYIWGDYIDELVVRDGTGGRRFYHRNAQYSIVALTNSSGTITERYAYDAYGDLTITDASGTVRSTSAESNRYTYTGREWDDTLDLYHFRARMYDPMAGRFVGRDPIGFRGSKWNTYEYVKSSPVRFLDPLGLQRIEEDCYDFVQRILRNEANGSSLHPAVSRSIECNANIHCGSCDGFEGETFVHNGRAQICLNKAKLRTTQGLSAILVHEAVHVGQMLDNNECLCKRTPHKGPNPKAPPVGGWDCDTCEERETDAYRQQGEYLCSSESPDCQDYVDALIEAGVCTSCKSSCKKFQGKPCSPFPEVPFSL